VVIAFEGSYVRFLTSLTNPQTHIPAKSAGGLV